LSHPAAQRASRNRGLRSFLEQRLEPGEIALLGGPEEPSCQFVAVRELRLEAPALLDVAPGAGG